MKKRGLSYKLRRADAMLESAAIQLHAARQNNLQLAQLLRQSYEQQLALLDETAIYDLQEQLRSGTIVTHLLGVDLDELKNYVRAVFIDAHPPMFIISQAEETANVENDATKWWSKVISKLSCVRLSFH